MMMMNNNNNNNNNNNTTTTTTTTNNNNNKNNNNNNNNNNNYRVSKQFAQALLGKAHLYQEDYSAAATAFEEVIGSGLYALFAGEYEDILGFN